MPIVFVAELSPRLLLAEKASVPAFTFTAPVNTFPVAPLLSVTVPPVVLVRPTLPARPPVPEKFTAPLCTS